MKIVRTALLAASVLALAGLAHAETLNIQTSFNAADFSTKYLTKNWLPKLKEDTGGRVELTLTSNGAVVPAKETPDAIAAGALDGDWTSISYFSGKEPAFALLGDLIAGYDTPAQMLGFCKDGPGEQLLQKAIDKIVGAGNIHVVACGPYSREALPARVSIKKFEDLAGKKIRAPAGLASAVFAAAGATPVAIPFSEVYSALEKGIVDAADASAYVNNDATGINSVAPHPLYPGIHSMPSLQFTISQEKWDALSPQDQKALRDWWYAAMEAMTKVVHQQDEALVKRDMADGKIHVIDWAQADRDKFRNVAVGEWNKFSTKSDLAKEAFDAHLAYMKKIGLLK